MNRRTLILIALLVIVVIVVVFFYSTCSKVPVASGYDDDVEQFKNEIRPEPIPITGKLKFDKSLLPEGARGKFASYDGDTFSVSFPPRTADAVTSQQVLDQTVKPLLQAMGYGDRLAEIALPEARPDGDKLPTPNLSALSKETCKEVEGERYQRFQPVCDAIRDGRSNEVADRVFDLAYGMTFAQFKADIERPRIQYVFAQRVQKVPIEHVGVIAARWEGETITTVHGTVLNRYKIVNSADLSPQQAVDMGQAQVLKLRGINPRFDQPQRRQPPELVLLPYGAATDDGGNQVIGLRYAYRTLLFALPANAPNAPGHLLSWMSWIDAKDGRLLALSPQFNNISGLALGWRRDPTTPTQLFGFQVDGAVGNQYTLVRTGVFNRFDRLGDGDFDDEEVSIPDSGVSSATLANFNQAPLNESANALCSAGGNNTFRQVNAYAHLHSFREQLINSGTFPTFPEAATTVWVDIGGDSNFAGYDSFGPGMSRLRFSLAGGFASPACPDVAGGVLSASNDVTGMTHEFTHISTKRLMDRRPADWCGMEPCMMPAALAHDMFHDFADAWAHAYASTPCMAGWYRKNMGGANASANCASHNEEGGLPRLASVGEPFSTASLLDHFPERRAVFTDLTQGYADGQIIVTALWLTRQGMRSKCLPSGTPQYWIRLNNALYNYGFLPNTCLGTCDRDVYIYSQNFLQQLAWQWANAGLPGGPPGFAHNGNHTTNKLLSAWARVGIFLVPFSCIDGDVGTTDATFCPAGELGGDAIVDVFDNDAGDDNVIDGITHLEVDYAQRGDPASMFRVWTGPRYLFNAAGVASSYVPSAMTPSPCFGEFQVELSDTDTFASIISSGWQPVSTTAQPECYGTWTPEAADWTTLGGASGNVRVYYRVRTRDGLGNERISTSPGNGSFVVPPAYLVVNDAGQP